MISHSRFSRPFRGVARAPRHRPPPSNRQEFPAPFLAASALRDAANFVPLLRDGERFSHTFALLLHGIPIRCSPTPHLSVPAPCAPVRRAGVVGHRLSASLVSEWESLRAACGRADVEARLRGPLAEQCVAPFVALVQAAPLLPFPELVVAIDALAVPRGRPGEERAMVSLSPLRDRLRLLRDRGIVRLRAAAEVAREGAESRYESLVRFELARMGLDDLDLQVDVCDDEGYWIGRFDLVDRARKLIIEYDGEQHRTDRAQYLKDLRRLERAREAGYRILRLHKEDFRPERLVATRRRLCEFLGRAPVPIAPHLARFFVEC